MANTCPCRKIVESWFPERVSVRYHSRTTQRQKFLLLVQYCHAEQQREHAASYRLDHRGLTNSDTPRAHAHILAPTSHTMLPSRLWYRHYAAVNTAATSQITGTIGSRGGSYMNYLGAPRTHACSKQVYAGILAAFFRQILCHVNSRGGFILALHFLQSLEHC